AALGVWLILVGARKGVLREAVLLVALAALITLDLSRVNLAAYRTAPAEAATFVPPLAQAIAAREGTLAPGRFRTLSLRDTHYVAPESIRRLFGHDWETVERRQALDVAFNAQFHLESLFDYLPGRHVTLKVMMPYLIRIDVAARYNVAYYIAHRGNEHPLRGRRGPGTRGNPTAGGAHPAGRLRSGLDSRARNRRPTAHPARQRAGSGRGRAGGRPRHHVPVRDPAPQSRSWRLASRVCDLSGDDRIRTLAKAEKSRVSMSLIPFTKAPGAGHGLVARVWSPLGLTVASLCGITLAFYHGLWLPGLVLIKRDAFVLHVPLKLYLMERLVAGELPHWFPCDGLGRAFICVPYTGIFAPFTFLFFSLPI